MQVEQLDIVLDQKQAQIFARAIYKNVSAYIQTHQEEYEQFLLEEKGADANDKDQSPHRSKGL